MVWSLRGLRQLTILDDHDAALADFNRSIELKPSSFLPYFMRAEILLEKREFAAARADLDVAVGFNPYIDWSYRRRAEALDQLDEPRLADADLRRARWLSRLYELAYKAGIARTNATLWADVARHCRAGDDLVWASIAVDEALKLNPDSPEALRERAALRLGRGELDAALADADRAVEISDVGRNLEVRGDVHFARNDFGRAIADYEAGNIVTESAARAYEARARQHKLAGRTTQEKADRAASARIRKLLDEP
jgi:tetratricopeptide (TPR) repeat protein